MTPPPKPSSFLQVEDFSVFSLSKEVSQAIAELGFTVPTPVQSTTIPLIFAGIDIIAQSQTGTGKTAAFAIPVTEMLVPAEQIEALILSPTRELAQQICANFESLNVHKNLHVTSIYGGSPFDPQAKELKTAQIIAATPGRLLDHLKRGTASLEHLKFFILDEADEMLSMGFEKELDAIVEFLPENCQSLLFSATVDDEIRRLASHFTTHPEFVSLSSDSVAAHAVEHIYHSISGINRLKDLTRLLDFHQPDSAIIFCNTRSDTQQVTRHLKRRGEKAELINGDLPQKAREKALKKVKQGNIRYLVATDVAARGIDISELPCVINYTMPDNPESYIHRTGRTGRAGSSGIALTLMGPKEIGTYYQLIKIFKINLKERFIPSREEIRAAKEKHFLLKRLEELEKQTESLEFSSYRRIATRLLESDDVEITIARLLALSRSQAIAAEHHAEEEHSAATIKAVTSSETAKATVEIATTEETAKAAVKIAAAEETAKVVAAEEAIMAVAIEEVAKAADPEEVAQVEEINAPQTSAKQTSERSIPATAFKTLKINIGAESLLLSENALDVICELSGFFPEDFGRITTRSKHILIDVISDYAEDVFEAIDQQTWRDRLLQVARYEPRRRSNRPRRS